MKEIINEELKKQVAEADEVIMFFLIHECSSFIYKVKHGLKTNQIIGKKINEAIKDIQKTSQVQAYIVSQLLPKFGIDGSKVKNKNSDYWKWYFHWDAWKNKLSDKKWEEVKRKIQTEESFDELLPKTKWNEKI